MPPLYDWTCGDCEIAVSLLRSFDDCKLAPQDVELGDSAKCVTTGTTPHRWIKIIHPPRIARGAGWGGSKGNWIQLFALGGWLWNAISIL